MTVAQASPVSRTPLSVELQGIAKTFEGRPARLRDLLVAVKGRGWFLILVLLSLPFLLPIPIPLLSTAFGLAICFIGTRLALGRRPWVPARLMDREIKAESLQKMLKGAVRVVRTLERFMKPRWRFMTRTLVVRRVVGVMIALSGALLLLPLPIPFSNTFPAWTVLLLAAGSLERDGAAWIAGTFCFLLTLAYFGVLYFGGLEAFRALFG